jgi:nitrite reductase/ring-hydroxylating ferredoxin subunit
MTQEDGTPKGPDFTKGVALAAFAENGMLVGHVGEDEVLLVRQGAEVFAVSAHCTHYHGPLAEGVVTGTSLRCPWHHACFDIRSGEALHAPAFDPLACWKVEQQGGMIFVREKLARQKAKPHSTAKTVGRIVIAGGGAAGFAAAEMLRRLDYAGDIIMVSDDAAPPVDRPNLSKDYLAGSAPEEWVPLRPEGFYAENGIDLRRGVRIDAIDPRDRQVVLADGGRSPMTGFCWRPAPNRCGSIFRARRRQMFSPCAVWPIAGRSSPAPGPRAGCW